MLTAHYRLISISFIVAVAVHGCGGDDDGVVDAGRVVDAGAMTIDGGRTDGGAPSDGGTVVDAGSTEDGGALLEVPVTETMNVGTGGTIESAHLCEYLYAGGGRGFGLQPNSLSVCTGGGLYLTFSLDTASTVYSAEAGGHLVDPSMPGVTTPVSIVSASAGTVSGDMLTVDDIPADTSVTLTTGELSMDFSFTGSMVTITRLELL